MTRAALLQQIATTIADYRRGRIKKPLRAHVEEWVNQFDAAVQLPILQEMDHVLKQTYFSKKAVRRFLRGLIRNEELVGDDPCTFWRDVKFLNIQDGGASQRDMLALFSEVLQKECGYSVDDCGANPKVFVYLDDAIFTGSRVKNDLTKWIADDAPQTATVHVLVIAIHEGSYYNRDKIVSAAQEAGKAINIQWWPLVSFENRKFRRDSSDILWPVEIPDDAVTQAYVDNMEHQPVLRVAGDTGSLKIFSSDTGRQLLEQEFLKAGAHIGQICPNLPEIERPLGHSYLETLGFGSTLVTYRNCPNNAALALWVGDPWYPLFPRVTNKVTSVKNLFAPVAKDDLR